MDITNNTSTTSIKTPEAESETPTRIQPPKPIYTNGLLKRHHSLIQQPPHPQPHTQQPFFVYRECQKNHAASIGVHALDGCGEFMPSSSSNPTDPTSLKCAACGCHRNFHRRETEQNHNRPIVEYHSPNRHQPPPPQADSPSSPSPPPISSSYYPASAPHMLLALSSAPQPVAHHTAASPVPHSNGRKRFRTKFTQHQKEKMLEFAGKVGWKIQKRDEAEITNFCNQIGVERGVLKVWMHNNKSTLGKNENYGSNKKMSNNNNGNENENSSSGSEDKMEEQHKNHDHDGGVNAANGNHGSSSSS